MRGNLREEDVENWREKFSNFSPKTVCRWPSSERASRQWSQRQQQQMQQQMQKQKQPELVVISGRHWRTV